MVKKIRNENNDEEVGERINNQRPNKTQEQFEKDIYDLVGDEYTILGQYVKAQDKLLARHNCKRCNNHEYQMLPASFLRGNSRCPICRTGKFDSYNISLNDDKQIITGIKNGKAFKIIRTSGDFARATEYTSDTLTQDEIKEIEKAIYIRYYIVL